MSTNSGKVIKSSLLLLGTRIIQRFLGLASTLLLARLLTPEDFGIVAIAAITVNLFAILALSGSEQYIIQKDTVDDNDLNSAWTIDIIMKGSLWVLLIIAAPYIASFLDKENIVSVLYVLSFTLLLEASQNPGLFLFKKNLQYKKIFYLTISQKFLSFFVVITLALATHSYWAIIIGDIIAAIVGFAGSYIIHNYRPNLSLIHVRKQWNFSKWMILKGVLGYARFQMDSLFVSKLFSTADLGRYHLSKDISLMPFSEIVAPISEPLLASFAKVKNDSDKLAYQCRLSLIIVAMIIAPICTFMWHFPKPIVDTLLGSQWSSTYVLFSYFSVFLFASSIGIILAQCFIVLGKVRAIFLYDLYSFILIALGLFLFLPLTLDEFSLTRGLLQIIATLTLLYFAERLVHFSILKTSFLCLPILVSAYISATATSAIDISTDMLPLFSLIFHTSTFFATYALMLVVFYFIYFKKYEETHRIKELTLTAIYSLQMKFFSKS